MRFNERASSYEENAVPQRVFAGRVAEFVGFPPPGNLLELGAGTGGLTRRLCARGFVVHATDAAPAMLEIGKQTVPRAHWSRLDAFGEAIPTSALQVSSGLLQWAGDPRAALAAWGRALTPDGRMIHAFPCEPCLREWRAVSHRSPILWRTEEAWSGMFAAAGLKVLRQELWVERLVFSSALEMVRGMHQSGITGQPLLSAGQLRQALRDYDVAHGSAQGVTATWAWLAIEASPGSRS